MRIMSLALGGCLKAPPVEFGITEDTGGHITYALGAAIGLAARDDVDHVEIVTRRFVDPVLGPAYGVAHDPLSPKLSIRRIDSGNPAYLAKEASVADRPAFTAALIAHLSAAPVLPDVLHAHFADAAEVAAAVRERFGIPFIYTAHSLGIDKARCMTVPGEDMTRRIALEGRAVAGADAIVASSRDEAERQLMLYPGSDPARIHCIAPGATLRGLQPADVQPADTARARALIAPFLRNMAKPILLAIARPVAKKNLSGLIDLYAADAGLRAKANLVIVAGLRDGPDSGEAEQRAVIGGLIERLDRHGLYGSLALPKRHDAADIAALYALTRDSGGVFINPAFTEPYGLTLTEAASHGLPVVATSHGGPADIVARLAHGRVADPSDAPAFGAAIHALLDDPDAWRAASVSGRVRSRALDWPHYAAQFVAVARGILAKPVAERPIRELLLCDIDNTLTGCARGAADLCGVIAERPDMGFGIATGRSLQEAQRLLSEWRYPAPRVLVTSVGSEIYWRDGARLVADAAFARQIADGWDAATIADVVRNVAGLVSQGAVEQRRFKLSYFGAGDVIADEVQQVLASAGLTARVVHSHGNLLDILPVRAGKGAAMRWVADRLGVPLARVHAAGDSGNDLDMLEACPNAIIVANHEPALAHLAGRAGAYVATRPHAGGIAEALCRKVAA